MANQDSFELHGWTEAVSRFEDSWYQLVTSPGGNISQAPQWSDAIVRATELETEFSVAVGSGDSKGVAFFPFRTHSQWFSGVPVRALEPAGNLVAYHQSFAGSGADEQLLESVLTSPRIGWDVFHAHGIAADSRTYELISRMSRVLSGLVYAVPVRIPYLKIDADWDEYLASRSKRVRKSTRRSKRLLEESGALEIREYTDEAGVPEFYESMLAIERASWKHEKGIAVTARPHEQEYYRRLLPFLGRKDHLFGVVVRIDDRPVAYNLSYRSNGVMGDMKTTFADEFRAMGAGSFVRAKAIEAAFRMGMREFDFLGETESHKEVWTDQYRSSTSVVLFNSTLRGRLACWMKRLRRSQPVAPSVKP